ncbi:tail fiber domain-containing protein [Rhizobium rhizogenes]|uniref:tail fiber domain-containing protein n=1 Tax=Rhizobium rhizogenes TaxID=359 RepID=UPI001572A377|nr:tail fiber domain-containing protein [Rhizobium rhizogenes]NTG07272.1 hypothetical protein [Rhizobium rhizogenes]
MGSSPNLSYGDVPTAGQWNQFFIDKQDDLGYTPLNQAGGSMTGLLNIFASSTSSAGINIAPGIAPSVPNNGDLWTTAAGIYAQINGVTLNLSTATPSFTSLTLNGSTSGSTTVQAAAVASGTITIPAATDTLVGKATTDTLTNKTFDTAGTGNALKINGVSITSTSGTGSVALTTSPTFTTPNIGAASGASLNLSGLTASAALATDASKNLVSVTNTGTGSNVLATSPTLVTPVLGAAAGTSLSLSGLTASSAVATDAGKNLVSVTNTGTGNNVLATSPTLVTPTIGAASGTSLNLSGLTASSAIATDASKNLVSVANTGTGSNVLAVSPALTGTPTAPTASAGNNSTQVATTAYSDAATALLAPLAGATFSGSVNVGTANVDPAVNKVIGVLSSAAGLLSAYATSSPLHLGVPASATIAGFYTNGAAVGSISVTGSATTYNTSSDRRLKTNIQDLDVTAAQTFVDALKPRTFTYTSLDGTIIENMVGFIADEFQDVSPSSVTGDVGAVDEDGNPVYQTMQASTAEVIANMIAALQQLQRDVAALKAA